MRNPVRTILRDLGVFGEKTYLPFQALGVE